MTENLQVDVLAMLCIVQDNEQHHYWTQDTLWVKVLPPPSPLALQQGTTYVTNMEGGVHKVLLDFTQTKKDYCNNYLTLRYSIAEKRLL